MTLHSRLLPPDTVMLERLLPGPIERVWSFLVDSEKRGRWFASGAFDLTPGGKGELKFDHGSLSAEKTTPERFKGSEGHRSAITITRSEPPHALAYLWGEGDDAAEVTFELAAQGDRVKLTLTHRKVPAKDQADVASAWDTHTGVLEDVLSGGEPRGFWSTHERLEEEYKKKFETP